MFHVTRSKIIAGAAVALLGVYSAVAGFAAPGVPTGSPVCGTMAVRRKWRFQVTLR